MLESLLQIMFVFLIVILSITAMVYLALAVQDLNEADCCDEADEDGDYF